MLFIDAGIFNPPISSGDGRSNVQTRVKSRPPNQGIGDQPFHDGSGQTVTARATFPHNGDLTTIPPHIQAGTSGTELMPLPGTPAGASTNMVQTGQDQGQDLEEIPPSDSTGGNAMIASRFSFKNQWTCLFLFNVVTALCIGVMLW